MDLKGGHGSDGVNELGGFFVMMNTDFTGTESSNSGDFVVGQDFRRVEALGTSNNK